jgi:hypothetical protein
MNNEGFVFTMTFEVKTKVALGMDVEIFFGLPKLREPKKLEQTAWRLLQQANAQNIY